MRKPGSLLPSNVEVLFACLLRSCSLSVAASFPPIPASTDEPHSFSELRPRNGLSFTDRLVFAVCKIVLCGASGKSIRVRRWQSVRETKSSRDREFESQRERERAAAEVFCGVVELGDLVSVGDKQNRLTGRGGFAKRAGRKGRE
jgi:hypothetical protein